MKWLFPFILIAVLTSCSQKPEAQADEIVESSPVVDASPQPEFDPSNSDPKAIEIAELVMDASGGKEAWENMGTIRWNFFGMRTLTWNKQTGDVRIEMAGDSKDIFLLNLWTKEGKVMRNGEELSGDELKDGLKSAESIWINDSYWLFMPFKLKDPGVSLKYVGMDTINGGIASHVIRLTFDSVGDTPENMYDIYVDSASNMVNQWGFYGTAQDTMAFATPWTDYKEYDGLMLSSSRGEGSIIDVEWIENPAPNLFSDF